MQRIKFIKSNLEFDVLLKMQSNNRIACNFVDFKDALNAPLSEGFLELNEHNGFVQSDYSGHKYIYKQEDDGLTFILTADENDVYVEPEPEPIPELEPYIPTFEDIKNDKINYLSSICNRNVINGVDVEIDGNVEHFSYKDEDQVNIKEIFDLAVQTNVPMYYHADGESCKLYTVEQIIAIYSTASANKMHHTTYFNQLKMFVDTLETEEDIETITYGQELTGEYLETYNASMAQAQLVLEAMLAKRSDALTEE